MSVVFHISGRSIHHVIVVFGAHVSNDDISRCFFHFLKILIFLVVRGEGGGGVKWQKMAQNVKKFCLSHFVSQELYLIWLWVLVHLCKMRISPATFFIFSTFLFFGFLGGMVKGQKMTHDYQFQSVTLYISRNGDHIMKIVGTQV